MSAGGLYAVHIVATGSLRSSIGTAFKANTLVERTRWFYSTPPGRRAGVFVNEGKSTERKAGRISVAAVNRSWIPFVELPPKHL